MNDMPKPKNKGGRYSKSIIVDGLKLCIKCGEWKPADTDHFNRRAEHPTGLNSTCRACRGIKFHPYIKDREGFRTCRKCGVEYPATTYYFHRNKSVGCGLTTWCKKCVGCEFGETQQYAKITREGYKPCSKCGIEYPVTPEYFARGQGMFGFSSRCKKCRYEETKERRKKDPEKYRLQRRKTWFRNHEHNLEYGRQWREKNREHMNELSRNWHHANKERSKQNRRRWLTENRERAQMNVRRRRARKKALPDTMTHEEWLYAVEYFNGCCAVCGRQCNDLFGDVKLAADHWIPLVNPNCPGTVATNMIPLCSQLDGCNNSKNGHDAAEWLQRKFGAAKAKKIMERIQDYFRHVQERKDAA